MGKSSTRKKRRGANELGGHSSGANGRQRQGRSVMAQSGPVSVRDMVGAQAAKNDAVIGDMAGTIDLGRY